MNQLRTFAMLLLLLSAQLLFSEAHTDSATISSSGGTGFLAVSGNTGTFEELISGSPATVSILLQGCMTGGTCDTLETNTSTSAQQLRKPSITAVYLYFKVTASWTGGTNVSVKVNATVAAASSGSLSGMTAGQVPVAATASTVSSSKAIQGSDASLLSSGTVSGAGSSLCTDANLGATTAGCNPQVGTIALPADFVNTGITFTRDAFGNYATSFNPDTYVSTWSITLTIFVDNVNGNDSTGTGLTGAPYKTVQKAFAVAQAAADTAIQITIKTNGADQFFTRDQFNPLTTAFSGKRIYVTTDSNSFKAYITSAQTAVSWSLTTGTTFTYQAARSSVLNVIDRNSKDAQGLYIPYTFAASQAAVETAAGSWWTDNTTVYIHTLTGAAPVNTTQYPELLLPSFDGVTLANSSELFFRNLYFSGAKVINVTNAASDYTNNKFVCYNCAFADATPALLQSTTYNGLSVDGIKTSQIYNSFSAYNGNDGFNFHYDSANPDTTTRRSYYDLVFGSKSYNQGLLSGVTTQNAFTAHDGASHLLVADEGWNTNGPVCAFVNASYTIAIGSNCHDSASASTAAFAHSAWYFDNASPPSGLTAKVYLEASRGGDNAGTNHYDFSSDGLVTNILLKDFIASQVDSVTWQNSTVLPGNGLGFQAEGKSCSIVGSGSPEGVVSGQLGCLYRRIDGSQQSSLYVKETSPTPSTGWIAYGRPNYLFYQVMSNQTISAPTATCFGACAGGTWTYKTLVRDAYGNQMGISSAVNATNAVTLTTTNKNLIYCPSSFNVFNSAAGPATCETYRTASAGTPANLSLVCTGIALSAACTDDGSVNTASVTPGIIVGTGAAVNVYSVTIPGNQIPKGGCVEAMAYFSHSTGSAGVTYQFSYGGSAVYARTATTAGKQADSVHMCNNPGDAGHQQGLGIGGSAGVGSTATSTVDSTASQAFTFTFNVANTDQVTPEGWRVKVLQPFSQ